MGKYGVKLHRSVPLALPRHPEGVEPTDWAEWAAAQQRPLAVDLFSGAGGLSFGLEQAGFCVALAVDHDETALRTHAHNLAGAGVALDLGDKRIVDELVSELQSVDVALVAGGPPCQPFSRAGRSKIRSLVDEGRRDADDLRRHLWRSFLRVVEGVRPNAVLMENVPDMALQDDLAVIRFMAESLETWGYEVQYRLVDTWRYGVPQHRQRLILVGMRDGLPFQWPDEEPPVTLRDAIGDLPSLGDTMGARHLRYHRRRLTPFQRRARAGMTANPGVIWDHVTRAVRDDDRQAFALMDSRTRYSDLPKEFRRYRADIFDDKYKRLDWNGLSRSITAHIAKDGYWYIHPEEPRMLSVREAARIQTFPDHFRFEGSRSDQFRQIGNAVPPALGRAMGAAIVAGLNGQAQSGDLRSDIWRRVRGQLLGWAAQDRASVAGWRYEGDPWRALAGTLLERARADAKTIDAFLQQFPEPHRLNNAGITRWALTARSASQRKAVVRLGRVASMVAGAPDSWQGDGWVTLAGLSKSQADQVRCLGLRADRVVMTAATIRVVGRVLGVDLSAERQLTDGRLAVAAAVGSGDQVSDVNAALLSLGDSICTPTAPRCHACPLRDDCVTAPPLLDLEDSA